MTLDSSRVVQEYKSNAGISKDIPKVEVLIEAIFNEIKNNGVVSASSGSVTGTCPPAGGPLTVGTLANGTIS